MSRLLDILSEPRQMAEERDDELSLLQRLVPAILGDDLYKDPVFYKDFAKEVITGPFLFSGELGHVVGNVVPAYIDTAIKNTIHNRAMGDDRPLFEGASELIGEPEDYVGTGDQFWDMLGAGFADTPNSIRARVAASPIDAAMVLAGIKAAPKAVNAVADAARTGYDNLMAPRKLNTGKYHGQRGARTPLAGGDDLSRHPTLEEFQRSQRPSKKIKAGSPAKKLRDEIRAKREERAAYGLLGNPPKRGGDWARRDGAADLRRRLERKQRIAAEESIDANVSEWVSATGASWNNKFANEVRAAGKSGHGFNEAVNRANMEAVPRLLKKQGWTMRHASDGRSGRKSSRYLVSPNKDFEIRLSDHYLPETPERQYRGRTRWNDEIVLRGRERPEDVVAAIQRAAKSDGELNADDILHDLSSQRPRSNPLGAQPIAKKQRGSVGIVDALTETRRPVDYTTKGGKSRVGQPKPGGGFYGAPDSIRTVEDLEAWYERRLHGLEQGVRGRDWYKNISEDIYKMTGGDVDFGDQMALATAITSNQSKVPDELAHAVRGVNQALVGDPVKTGRFHGWDVPSHYAFENPKTYGDSMSYKIEQLFDSPIEDLRGGMKTDPYALNKSVEWRPELASQRPVNDEHMVSAFEYNVGRENPLVAPNPSQHRWMDIQQERIKDMANERQIGGFDDWDYSSEQAAQWVYEKGLKDYNAAVKKSGKAPHDLDYYIDQASRTYREIIQDNPQLLAYITRENIPGESTGHLPELLEAGRAERDEFSDVIEAIIAPEGTDRLTSGTNTLTWGTLPNEAAYEGAANKGYITPVLVTKEMGGSSIDPSAAKLLDADAAAHSIFNPQQQVAWNYVPDSKSASAGEHAFTGLTFDADGPMDVDAFRALQSDLNEIGIDTSMVDQQGARALVWEPVVDKPDGDIVTFNLGKPQSRRHSMTPEQRAKFNADMKATDRKALLKQAKKIAEKHGVKLKRTHTNTNIFPVADDYGKAPDEWSVKPFVEAVEAAGPGHVARFDKNVAPLAKPMLDEVSRIAKQRGYTMAEWYKPMMEGLAEGGLSRLKELVQAGVVPAAALAVFLPMLSPPATSGDNPSQS